MGWFSNNQVVSDNPKNVIHMSDGSHFIAVILLFSFICLIVFLLIKEFLRNFMQRIITEIMDTLQQRPAIIIISKKNCICVNI